MYLHCNMDKTISKQLGSISTQIISTHTSRDTAKHDNDLFWKWPEVVYDATSMPLAFAWPIGMQRLTEET